MAFGSEDGPASKRAKIDESAEEQTAAQVVAAVLQGRENLKSSSSTSTASTSSEAASPATSSEAATSSTPESPATTSPATPRYCDSALNYKGPDYVAPKPMTEAESAAKLDSKMDPTSLKGQVIMQFRDADGNPSGPEVDIDLQTTKEQLGDILNALLENENKEPFTFQLDG
jgi:hypothetical protein